MVVKLSSSLVLKCPAFYKIFHIDVCLRVNGLIEKIIQLTNMVGKNVVWGKRRTVNIFILFF